METFQLVLDFGKIIFSAPNFGARFDLMGSLIITQKVIECKAVAHTCQQDQLHEDAEVFY